MIGIGTCGASYPATEKRDERAEFRAMLDETCERVGREGLSPELMSDLTGSAEFEFTGDCDAPMALRQREAPPAVVEDEGEV